MNSGQLFIIVTKLHYPKTNRQNSYQINIIQRKYQTYQLINNSMEHVICHNSTAFRLSYMKSSSAFNYIISLF